jgi:hypothetical protein
MTKQIENNDHPNKGGRPPRQVRLPGFVSDEEIGLGDVIKRATSYFGIQACGGCEQRRVALNRWMVFTKGRRR